MAKTEIVKFSCDRCGVSIGKPDRVLTFTKDISDLWKPKTWGTLHKGHYDLCDKCFSSFVNWLDFHDLN